MASRTAVAEIHADVADHASVRAVRELVSGGPAITISVGDRHVVLPRPLVEALAAAAGSLDEGDAIAIVNETRDITPAQAARLLGVSRQYVDRLIDADVLPVYRLPGSRYRRLAARDVLRLKADRDRKRRVIDDLVNNALDEGLPY